MRIKFIHQNQNTWIQVDIQGEQVTALESNAESELITVFSEIQSKNKGGGQVKFKDESDENGTKIYILTLPPEFQITMDEIRGLAMIKEKYKESKGSVGPDEKDEQKPIGVTLSFPIKPASGSTVRLFTLHKQPAITYENLVNAFKFFKAGLMGKDDSYLNYVCVSGVLGALANVTKNLSDKSDITAVKRNFIDRINGIVRNKDNFPTEDGEYYFIAALKKIGLYDQDTEEVRMITEEDLSRAIFNPPVVDRETGLTPP